MLKTNSKQARENIRTYIIDNVAFDGYGIETPATFEGIAAAVLDVFRSEYRYSIPRHACEQEAFIDWCSGLPSVLDCCYFYNRSAVDDLAAILEETDAEKSRFLESDAEKLLSVLIYRELMKGAR